MLRSFMLLNTPNLITSTRVVLALPVALLLVQGDRTYTSLALGLAIFAEVTDALDGYAARKTGQTSTGGKIFDPFADSIYRTAVFFAFVSNDWMPLWMLYVSVSRDVAIAHMRLLSEQYGVTVSSRSSGKAKAILQAIAQLTVIAFYAIFQSPFDIYLLLSLQMLLFVSTLTTLYSLIDYGISVTKDVK